MLTQHRTAIRKLLQEAAAKLQTAGVESATLDARLLMEHTLQISREELLMCMEKSISPEQEQVFKKLVDERTQRRPIAQIIGKREFWGREFMVSAATLDPRPDSETLIEVVLERIENRNAPLKLLDLGTGTGCLLLSLLAELPQASGVAVDFSDAALVIAAQNSTKLGVADRVTLLKSRWLDKVEGIFDVVISNPPYIKSADIVALAPEVAKFEPHLALDGGEDGLDCYREIINGLPKILAKNGFAALEIGVGQEADIEKIAAENGLNLVASKKDLGGIIRCLILQQAEL